MRGKPDGRDSEAVDYEHALSAARVFREATGRWPSPAELRLLEVADAPFRAARSFFNAAAAYSASLDSLCGGVSPSSERAVEDGEVPEVQDAGALTRWHMGA